MKRPGRWTADLVLLLATAVWGMTFVIVGQAVQQFPPVRFVALRFTIAALVFAPFVLRRHGPLDRRAVKAGLTVGVCLFAGFALQTMGLVTVRPARAAFITGLSVVLVPLFVMLVYRRLPAPPALLGVLLAVPGLALLTGLGRGGLRLGDLLVLGGAVGFALQILAVDRYSRRVGAARLLLAELGAVALLAWPATLAFEAPLETPGPGVWGAVLATALLATLGALWAQNWAQQRTPPTRAAIILTMEPVFASLHSYFGTGERLGGTAMLGAMLIVVGMLAAELPPLRLGHRGRPRIGRSP